MESYRLFFYLVFFLLLSCEDAALDEMNGHEEKWITGKWNYEIVEMDGQLSYFADSTMEAPIIPLIRFEIVRRSFHYDTKGYYKIDYVRNGYYRLGTLGDENWQPDMGTYTYNDTDSGEYIIHNPGLPYEKTYSIETKTTGDRLVRTSTRYMSQPGVFFGDTLWRAEDRIFYKEVFNRDYN